ncbi:MAG: hypothetical protein CVV47_12120 [Spirochaetae bacterium HGW-Spirochaetae-3]|jgi:PAS domain S-box-containing protein|nr:MAG: hypothetical protein CVV47_12120 [Spirochaetae bacterium HGW-Spirochaetae-3]
MIETRNKAILLVEDEALIAMSEIGQLKNAGYRPVWAVSGERALEIVRSNQEPVDLVLMDINLGGGMDGTEAAREILAANDVPVVFLSSHLEEEIVRKTEEITNYGYVVKNSSFTVLDASIKMAFKLFDAHCSIRSQKMEIEAAYEQMQVANEELLHTQEDLIEHARALDESERTFRSLFEKGPIGTAYHRMVYDDAGRPVDYVILDANKSYEDMTGVAVTRGQRITELFPGIQDDPFDWIGRYAEVAKTGNEMRFQQYFRFTGRWYDIVVYRNKPDHFVTSFFDITERKRAEDALKQSEEKFREMVWDMQVGVLLQGPSAEILLSNPKALEYLGLSEDQLLGVTSFDPSWNVIHEDGAPYPGDTHPVPVAIATREPVRNRVLGVYRPKSRDRVWLSVDAVPQLREDGSVRQVVCTFIDISERKRAEERVENLLRDKELVLKEVHHRIKNNMQGIGSLLQIQADAQADGAAKDALGEAVGRVSSLAVLYDKLYRAETVGSASLKEYLPSLATEIARTYPSRKRIALETRVDDIPLDAKTLSPIGLIVNELMTNAIKHAFAGRPGGRIVVSAVDRGGRVRLVVEDDGIGLPEKGAASGPGGFGMQLVEALVEQIAGTLSVERDGGTRFAIEFDA